MKKALPLLVLLLALAAVVVFTRRRTGGGAAAFPASRAAELAPAEAVAYLEIPDLGRTESRWRQGELYAITQEPGWKDEHWQLYLDTWVRRAQTFKGNDPFFSLFAEFRKAEPAGLFVAANDLGAEKDPELVGGFSYRGKKTDLESAVRLLKEALLKGWPGAKSEISRHEGIEIESITSLTTTSDTPWRIIFGIFDDTRSRSAISKYTTVSPGAKSAAVTRTAQANPALHLAFRDNWLFFSSHRNLLADTLDRYLAKPGAAKNLAQDAVFADCRLHGVPEADFLAWARWAQGGRRFAQKWLPRSVPAGDEGKEPVEAVQYTWRLDGAVRDRLYFHCNPAPLPPPPLGNRSLALSTPEARGYLVINVDALRGQGAWVHKELWWFNDPDQRPALLKARQLTLDELWVAFGPELGVIYYDKGQLPWPHFVAALEVRDPAKARKFAEVIAGVETSATMTEIDGMTQWDWNWIPEAKHSFRPPMVLTKTHLLFGSSLKLILETAARVGQTAPTLQANPGYAAAMEGKALPNGELFYVDTEAFFLNGELRPPAFAKTYEPLWSPNLPWQAIRKHLRPGTICVRTEGQGWVVESTLNVIGLNLVNQVLLR